ncbi:hypothetical protein DT73_22545 [Mangrovibacter sp. MFB070]|uniref:hypothetical protein n=1 Tax=Mangrovibacter sp. MFB070 TaxID=1224318 RepID=UPI0004D86074|nr:hypothetical protein [Mangrovibacter sp. MFB070]KEA50515.1 hypothetical protein DT73_22545 [Mangrovibacter sp. MFB070]
MINPEFSLLSLIRKPVQQFSRRVPFWLLCFGLYVGLPGGLPMPGYSAQSNLLEPIKAYKTCSQQLTPSDDRYLGRVIQTQLASLYQNNEDFQAQLKKNSRPLTDGIVGPTTRYWLDYFCGEFAFSAPASSTNQHQYFIESLLIDLSRAAQLNTLFPTWRTAIKPPELLHLTSAEIVKRLSLSTSNTDNGSGTSIPATTPGTDRPDSDTEAYYYQLTENDFASLALRQTVLEEFAKLEKQQFDQRSQLYNQLSGLFTQLNIPITPQLNLDNLIDSYTIEIHQPSTTATTSTSTSQITNSVNNDASTGNNDTNAGTTGTNTDNKNTSENNAASNPDSVNTDNSQTSPDNQDSTTPNTSNQVVETSTQSNTETTAQQLVWQVNADELSKTIKQAGITTLSKDELKALAPLQDEVFPSLYLMQMAVKESGISPAILQDKGVFTLARKTGLSPVHAVPVQWVAPPDCDCQDSVRSVFNVGTFYGFYPYWQHLGKGQTLDFSRLDRIGYIGAVMKPELNGNTLVLPQNWLADPRFSQFIQTSHRYRTKLDLVVTTPRNLSTKQLTGLFTDDMVKRLVESVTTPMDKYLINNVQPWISFGAESVPAMADGITLDIDLSVLNTPESQQAFFSFLNKLKIALRQSYQPKSVASDLDGPAQSSDEYYLNIVVPISDMVASNNGFYSFQNIDTLSQLTNLLIARPGSPVTSDDAYNGIKQIKELQRWLSDQKNQSEVQQVYKRLVPMLITEDNRNQTPELTQLVNLSSWSFLGAAYWPLPLSETNEKLIEKTFFPAAKQYPKPINQLLNGINSLLNWFCIYRLELRAGLFVSFMFILGFLVACIWCFPLRKHLSRVPFVALTSISISGLMLVFVADPAFQNYQGPIMLVSIVVIGWILFAVRMVRKEGDKP